MIALQPYFRPITALKGVGPQLADACRSLLFRVTSSDASHALPQIRDVLFHAPMRYDDRRVVHVIADVSVGVIATLRVRIVEHVPPKIRVSKRGRPLPYRVIAEDDTGSVQCIFYHARGDYLTKSMPVGETRIISGRIDIYDGAFSITHPDFIVPESRAHEVLRIQSVYPASMKLSSKQIARMMLQALAHITPLPEWLSENTRKMTGWPSFADSLRTVHAPKEYVEDVVSQPAWHRLAYDELLAHQLMLMVSRKKEIAVPGVPVSHDISMQKQLLSLLPFELTFSQQQVAKTIFEDMASGRRMVRLVQGDVGSGKTILAFAAMLQAAAAGHQALLMAPTDVLARQHLQSLQPLAEKLGFRMAYLSGKMPKKEQAAVTKAVAAGEIHFVVGTHALFQEKVAFQRLALVVIDEQQRFGVEQRMALIGKASAPHVLQLSATPIPRSLMMACYGDMDISILSERPVGRKPIETRVVPLSRQDEVIEGMARAITQHEKIFWVCPLIEPSDEDIEQKEMHETAAAEDRYKLLHHKFPGKVGLIHGRMKPAERDAVMRDFAFGDLQILVATTVIEVGVNVPEATIMVIESAERFGLSQLHQLRGRVGRGDKAAHCILLYRAPLSENGKARLSLLRETQDGFVIAEEDLRLRGAGDVLGTKQTGLPEFHFADIMRNAELMRMARDEAQTLWQSDPNLQSERGRAVQLLLRLFGYDDTVQALKVA